MALTRRDYEELADTLNKETIIVRVKMFNALVPWLKTQNPRFKLFTFYERVFIDCEPDVDFDEGKEKAYPKIPYYVYTGE